MKKVSALAIVLLSIVLLPCYGQVNGLDLTTAIPGSSLTEDDPIPWEELIDYENGGYFMGFKQTPVGYKHCLDKAKKILSDNGKSFSKDRIVDDVMYPSFVDGLTDYQNMPYALRMSTAEVALGWELTDEYLLGVRCDDETFQVYLLPIEGLEER